MTALMLISPLQSLLPLAILSSSQLIVVLFYTVSQLVLSIKGILFSITLLTTWNISS